MSITGRQEEDSECRRLLQERNEEAIRVEQVLERVERQQAEIESRHFQKQGQIRTCEQGLENADRRPREKTRDVRRSNVLGRDRSSPRSLGDSDHKPLAKKRSKKVVGDFERRARSSSRSSDRYYEKRYSERNPRQDKDDKTQTKVKTRVHENSVLQRGSVRRRDATKATATARSGAIESQIKSQTRN